MAIENNYGGPPSLEIYQEFVRSSDTSVVNQNAVIVAPHYNVKKVENADKTDIRDYATGTTYDIKWKDLESTLTEADVDKQSVNVVFTEAYVTQATVNGTLDGDGSSVIVLEYDIDGVDEDGLRRIPEPVVVGDIVHVYDPAGGIESTIAEIVSIGYTPVAVPAPVAESYEVSGTGKFTVDGTYEGSSDKAYYIKVDSIEKTSIEGSDPAYTLNVIIFTNDGTDRDTCQITEANTEVALAHSGLTISSADLSKFTAGDTYVIKVKSEGLGKRNVLYLNKNIEDGKNETALKIGLGKPRSLTLEDSQYTVSSTGIHIGDIYQSVMISGTMKDALVICGTFVVEYRSLCRDFVGRIGAITYDNILDVGYTGIENPLGAMVSAALKGGSTVYCVGVTADTVDAYRKAFVLLSRSTDTYGVVIGSLRPDVIAEADTFVTQQSAPDVANYKILYYGLDTNPYKAILTKTSSGSAVQAIVENGVMTLYSADASTSFMLSGVESGDILRINYNANGYGDVSYEEYVVDYVTGDSTLKLKDETLNISVPMVFEIYREYTGSELVSELKSRVLCANHRCYCVFGDGISVDGIEDAPAWLLAALPAGMRAGEYCHRPISNLVYSGCEAENKICFNSYELKELASRGVWILTNNADGSSVYNYHQLSTDMSDKKKQEQSYTTNFDNISRRARALMSPYYGNSNISDDFIRQLYAHLVALYGGLTTNAPTAEIGPQLISYENLDLRQDKVNRDHIYMEVDYNMPAPFNHVKMYQRLI